MTPNAWLTGSLIAALATIGINRPAGEARAAAVAEPRFELVQPELFAAAGGQPNCWADFDGDGDLDLFVGFRARRAEPALSQRQRHVRRTSPRSSASPTSTTRAPPRGATSTATATSISSSASRARPSIPSKLYRNDGAGKPFTDVAKALGLDAPGETRQSSLIDYDNDGDLDFFVGLRDAPNMLFRNDGKKFTSVGKEMGIDDPRRTVGAVWFDMDHDGDLDVFVANQNGDLNGLFRNDGTRFVDVAKELGMDAAGRPQTSGSNGPSVADYDNDGDSRSVRRRIRRELSLPQRRRRQVHRGRGADERRRRRAGDAVALGRFRQRRTDRSLRLVVHRQADQRARLSVPQRRRALCRRDSRRTSPSAARRTASSGSTSTRTAISISPSPTTIRTARTLSSAICCRPEQARRSIQVLVQDAQGTRHPGRLRGARLRCRHAHTARHRHG